MPFRGLVVAAVVLFSIPPMILLARRHNALRMAVPLAAAFVASRVFFGALFGWRVALAATSGESVDVMQRERILAEAVTDYRPLLAFGAVFVVAALAWSLAAFARGRALLVVSAAMLLAPLAWIGTRDVGLHERLARAELAKVPAGTSLDACGALEGAVAYAGDLALAARVLPDVRARAHACVAFELDALAADGADGRTLRFRAEVWRMMHPGQGSKTALDLVEESPLVVDAAQRAEIARRRAHG